MSPNPEHSTGRQRLLLALAGFCGLGGILIEHGTYPGPGLLQGARVLSGLAVLLFAVELVLAWRVAAGGRAFLRLRWPHLLLLTLLAVESLVILAGGREAGPAAFLGRLDAGALTRAYLLVIQVYIVGVFAVELPHLHRRFASWRVRPALSFVLVFAALILVGALLLSLPRATPPTSPIDFLDALFTATSAVCVTGLVVRETGADFTLFGQTVILILIQLGGLGIMSLSAAIALLLGRGIGVRESSLLREVFQVPMMAAVGRTIRLIIAITLGCEAVGALLIWLGLDGVVTEPGARIFTAVFHAVSAFCNAGFSTWGDSLVAVADRPLVTGTAGALFVLGGLGFGVLTQLGIWLWARLVLRRRDRRRRLNLHARVVLWTSGALLVAGTAALLLLEWNGALAGNGFWGRLGRAAFQSATCRTAGFNSVDLGLLGPASLFVMMVLMSIGGAPGSTAGGIKVTALAVMWANLRSIARGQARVRLDGRELDPLHVRRAMLVISAGLVVATGAILALLVTEAQPLGAVVFEVVSALGTVGLSLGLTPLLSPLGRLIVMALMFFGRLGPLTLAASLTGSGRDPRVRLPRGRILIG